MKKASDDGYEVLVGDSFDDICGQIKETLPYPFESGMLNLLKKENKLEQNYYYVRRGGDFAFFVLYKNRMNIFTFGKLSLYLKLKVIGYPCSFSNCGYVTNNERMMLEYIKTIKGAKLVLNVVSPVSVTGVTVGETLPTCIFDNPYETAEAYIRSLRSSYRRRINKAIDRCQDVAVRTVDGGSEELYALYLNTYRRSDYKLEKLEKGFFDRVDAWRLGFFRKERLTGFVLLKKCGSRLIFMLCGMDYRYDTADLYYYMLYRIIVYAIENGCLSIDFGQTSEETKMKFGAHLEARYFYAHHTNKLLNDMVRRAKSALEYKYGFPDYHVFQRETR